MTVGIAWIRRAAEGEELWIASDSRLGGDGLIWDDCPKLLLLPRRDAVAAFAGSTRQAYPLLMQMANALVSYAPARTGSLEWFDAVGHLERVANAMLDRVEPDPAVRGTPEAVEFRSAGDSIILGGYSRAATAFIIRALEFNRAQNRWRFARVRGSPAKLGANKVFRIFGDGPSQRRFRELLENRLRAAGKLRTSRPFDFEPLETLWDFLTMPASRAIPLPASHRPSTTGAHRR